MIVIRTIRKTPRSSARETTREKSGKKKLEQKSYKKDRNKYRLLISYIGETIRITVTSDLPITKGKDLAGRRRERSPERNLTETAREKIARKSRRKKIVKKGCPDRMHTYT